MSQRRLFVTTACAVAALLATTLPAQAQNIKQRTLKFSYVLAPETALGEGARKFADLVKTRSGGKIEIKQFPNGVLGGDAAMMSSLQGGTVDFTAVTAGLLYGHVKSYVVLDIPFQFNSVKEADAVVDGPLGKKLSEQLPAKGLIGLAFWEYGYRCLSNSKKPVAKVEDLAGMKIRVIQAPIYIDTFNALGANSVPMPACSSAACATMRRAPRTGRCWPATRYGPRSTRSTAGMTTTPGCVMPRTMPNRYAAANCRSHPPARRHSFRRRPRWASPRR